MICHTPKHGVWHLSQVSSMFWNKVIISLHEDVLDLQRPLHLVLGLQIKLRLTKIIPHDYPCQKTWGLTPKSSLQHVQNQINNFTPWRHPWPPTVPEPCSWPSERSEAHTNGPIWFPMPKNMGFDTKIKCQIQINNFTPWRGPWPPTAPPPISWPSDQSEAHENGPTWFPMVPHAKEHGVWHQNQVSIAWPEIFDTLWKTYGEPNSTRLSRVLLLGAPVWATRDLHFWIPR